MLVANRGEVALRVVRACRELGLPSVAVFSEADESALHVNEADEAVNLGPAPAAKSYLNIERVLSAARETGATLVHPGYGFLSERADFARACEAEDGLSFVGPSAEAMGRLGDKAEARRLAREAGVPVVPGTDGVASPGEAVGAAEEVGYPVMIKAAAGGGGRGIRVAKDEEELKKLVREAKREAEAAFGDGSLYLERFLADPRHVEVQVIADSRGNAAHLFERECSMQRSRQKVLEEAPSAALSPETRRRMCEAALSLVETSGYVNAGTVEFLVEGSGPEEEFFFIEMNTRIQVEHPVTEMLTGVDLVKEQLRVALGEPLGFGQDDLAINGHAIEFRINAEDPDQSFLPSPGTVSDLRLPGGPGVRVDSALYAGYTVPPFYDSLVGKLIVWGRDREEAIARSRRALGEYHIEGIKTTVGLHLRLLDDKSFLAGDYGTSYLETLLSG